MDSIVKLLGRSIIAQVGLMFIPLASLALFDVFYDLTNEQVIISLVFIILGLLAEINYCVDKVASDENKSAWKRLKNEWSDAQAQMPVKLVLSLLNGEKLEVKVNSQLYLRVLAYHPLELMLIPRESGVLNNYSPKEDYTRLEVYCPILEAGHRKEILEAKLKIPQEPFVMVEGQRVLGKDVANCQIRAAS